MSPGYAGGGRSARPWHGRAADRGAFPPLRGDSLEAEDPGARRRNLALVDFLPLFIAKPHELQYLGDRVDNDHGDHDEQNDQALRHKACPDTMPLA